MNLIMVMKDLKVQRFAEKNSSMSTRAIENSQSKTTTCLARNGKP